MALPQGEFVAGTIRQSNFVAGTKRRQNAKLRLHTQKKLRPKLACENPLGRDHAFCQCKARCMRIRISREHVTKVQTTFCDEKTRQHQHSKEQPRTKVLEL